MTMGPAVRKYSAVLALYFLCMGLWYPVLAEDSVVIKFINATGDVGDSSILTCSAVPINASIEWSFKEEVLNNTKRLNITEKQAVLPGDPGPIHVVTSTLTIANSTANDAGEYTCTARVGDDAKSEMTDLKLRFDSKFVNATGPLRVNVSTDVSLECYFEVYENTTVNWVRLGPDGHAVMFKDDKPKRVTPKEIVSVYNFRINSTDNNGTYYCEIEDFAASGTTDIFVLAQPTIEIGLVVPINTTQIYLNWTVNKFNSPILSYALSYRKHNEVNAMFSQKIDPNNTSFVLGGLEKNTTYVLTLEVTTNHSKSNKYGANATTLEKEPVFVPDISIKGFSATSVTIGWASPPNDIAHLIHYYLLEARKKGETEARNAYHSRDIDNLPYMFDHLDSHSTYSFRVCACSDFTKTCGDWSKEMEAATLDGTPGKPTNVTATCMVSFLNLTWSPPEKRNAEIKGYTLEITGNATYRDRFGKNQVATWGPFSKFTTNDANSTRVNDLQPNTLYTVKLSAMTRTRRRGEEVTRACRTGRAPPDAPPRPKWRKILENDKYMFKLYLPRISERNGPICCYRVYVVRLPPNSGLQSLHLPSNSQVYEDAHASPDAPEVGAYITDVFSNDNFPPESELVIGDGQEWFNRSEPTFDSDECRRCVRRRREHPAPAPPPPTPAPDPLTVLDEFATSDPFDAEKLVGDTADDDIDKNEDVDEVIPYDRPLDSNSNYTLFVELITAGANGTGEHIFSDYTAVLRAAASPPASAPLSAVELALQITCAVAAVILLLMIIFCIMQTRRSRKMPPHGHLEMNSIPAIIRHMVGGFCGRQQLVAAVPPDKPPIAKEDLPEAYAERQADSDYLFQKEFELLPEYFPDRTTHASEARENQPKNRYPDIKAYDQTRVKLSQIDSITGSDYINANYVMGYQERKQFICAQGPTDTTVNDFWRMIWEHGLELIVMLTNLEEYSKVKCSKYWPEERAARAFGNITVQHVGEKRYSDYIVRELKITKQTTNSDGQPIVENNGIAKRNGDVKDAECSGSAPTSPRESREGRLVRQYHFLMWKDFAAPEQPHSILKFIKRVNEAWASVVGRPIVVHCSAGVGRTGTLVALDCLLEQLRATGQVAVFNTVAELRRQRNFLVQSLKQYVFVYRALVEYAHYGDTEIPAGRLKPAVDRLRNTPEGADKCLMEIEFEKILSRPVAEPLKSCAAGAGEELRSRNRSDECLPYDRNRVILTPLPNRDYSTYINACFIEAYDNTEGFIITQDPLPNTIMDFWRMVSEHNVTTIVMLSELGEGKCPRYWDDGSIQYEHISVQYEESESCPYYTRRQFTVTNEKSGEVSCVRQLQYQGWPTAPGHVPEVTRGLAELADAAAPHHAHTGTMLVHCQFGTERSPLFVALCTLIRQLRVERRVDVSAAARAVRHQRARTIDTFLQYEFLYRAILNYAELHNLLEDS